MEKAVKDARFEEAKLRMVMKLKKVSCDEAEKFISNRSTACAVAVGKRDDDLISADEFFGGM